MKAKKGRLRKSREERLIERMGGTHHESTRYHEENRREDYQEI